MPAEHVTDARAIQAARWMMREFFGDLSGVVLLGARPHEWPAEAGKVARRYERLRHEEPVRLSPVVWEDDRWRRGSARAAAVIVRERHDFDRAQRRPSLWWHAGEDEVVGLWLLDRDVDQDEMNMLALTIVQHIGGAAVCDRNTLPLNPDAEFKYGAHVVRDRSEPLPKAVLLDDIDTTPAPVRRYAPEELLALRPHDPDYGTELHRALRRRRADVEARELLATERADQRLSLPDDRGLSVAAKLLAESDAMTWLVEGLHAEEYSSLLVGQPKVGKSTLALNLVASLVDEEPFLGEFKVHFPEGNVGYLNFEMTQAQFLREVRLLDVGNDDRLFEMSLRSHDLSLSGRGGEVVAEWCRDNRLDVLILDAVRRVYDGQSENDNTEMDRFLRQLDYFKERAGVRNLILLAHAGWGASTRNRGASNLSAWADSLWSLSADGSGSRFFQAEGRHEPTPRLPLTFDAHTNRLSVAQRMSSASAPMPLNDADHGLIAVKQNPDVRGATEMRQKVRGRGDERDKRLRAAAASGFIVVNRRERPHRYEVTDAGEYRFAELRESGAT